jgi:Tfp pilus assembly protein PilN
MRPVNLIPAEERRGPGGKLRTGPMAYILIAALVLVLGGVTMLVLTENQISETKGEVAQLKSEAAASQAEAQRLAAYTQFQALHEQRVQTISSLANSRFDWERVMRELALVLPHSVWLTSMSASASVESEGSGGGGLGSSILGPSLQIEGCAVGQEAVAGFVTDLKQIEGVTRVGVESSELPSEEEGSTSAESGSSTGSGGAECQTRKSIAKFQLTVAFDAAPVPAIGEGGEAPAGATEIAESTSESASESEGASSETASSSEGG